VNKQGRFLSAEPGNTPMNFDANGLCSVPPLKPGSPRIDIVGDSITQGYAIADDKIFAWRFAEAKSGLSVVILGVGGYCSYQSLLRIESRRGGDPPNV
jgi:hypothetical protein